MANYQRSILPLIVLCFIITSSFGQEIHNAVRQGNIEKVNELLEKNSELVNERNAGLWTPLHVAVSLSNKEMVELLIKKGADVNARDNVQFTPLHRCMYKADLDVIQLLIRNGADLNVINIEGVTPLSMAVDFEKSDAVKLMLRGGAQINFKMRDNETVLHHAAERGNVELMTFLLDNKANVNERKKYDITPLHIASVYGNKEAVQLLINRGGDLNAESAICGTPLHQAAAGRHDDIVDVLLTNGADKKKRSFPVVEGDYLGEKQPGLTPKIFAQALLKNIHRWVMPPTFSPDGKEIYWSASAPHSLNSRIWYMQQEDGSWTPPKVVSFSSRYMDQNPFFSPAGDRMVFVSDRSEEQVNIPDKDRNFWIVERKKDMWGKPKNMGSPVNTENHEFHATLNRSGTLYFYGDYGENRGASDLYQFVPEEGEYSKIKNLGDPLNTEHPEAEPAVAPDGSYIIFVSLRPENHTFFDLYVSFKKKDENWTEAVNMGKNINRHNCRNPKISPDGKFIFFSSDDDRNIYWVDAKIIEALKPTKLK